MTEPLRIGSRLPSIEEVAEVARQQRRVELDPTALRKIEQAREVVQGAVKNDSLIYGITTGFGALASVKVDPEDLEDMQGALLRSHATAVGDPLPTELVRAILLLRSKTLAQGHSGVRPVIIERLLDLLNEGLHPVVPEQGSVGASGDLAQLAHLALPLIGEGHVEWHGEHMPAGEGLARIGREPLRLSFKEGLSLLNGTEAMLAAGCLALVDAQILAKTADVVCAMSVEALLGTDRAFDTRVHALRPHRGQQDSASNLRRMLEGSQIIASHKDSGHAVQDAYSVRCAPQVHGAAGDVLAFARSAFETEIASVTDNPIVFPDSAEVLSAGNFHGEVLGFALDFMAAAVAELASISERRTDRMLDPNHSSGLPPFLTQHAGTDSGFMLTQYTQAALVAENRILSHPATVDTIPTSGSQEDHVSFGWTSALKLRRVIKNTSYVLAIEAMCAAQGIDLRSPLAPSKATSAAHDAIRGVSSRLERDRALSPEIERVQEMVLKGELLKATESVIGELA